MTRQPLPMGAELCGAYIIERVLGAGGFGITYLATDIALKIKVAVKEYFPSDFGTRDKSYSIRPVTDQQTEVFEWGKASFIEEARTLARFDHSSIVRVYRVFEAVNTAYMVLKYEEGQSLAARLERNASPPTQAELDAMCERLLDALALMHGSDFIHRDIAPDNIILRPDGTPVLLDFGSARRALAERSATLTRIIKGGYSPPEQYAAKASMQGPWSDLYALGATLYRAVTGMVPLDGMSRIEDELVPATKAARGAYRPEFLAAIDWAMRVKPSERPQSVEQLRPALLAHARARAEPRMAESAHQRPRPQPVTGPPSQQLITGPNPTGPPRNNGLMAVACIVLGIAVAGYWLAAPSDKSATRVGGWETRVPAELEGRIKAEQQARADAEAKLATVEAERRRRETELAARRDELEKQRLAALDDERRRVGEQARLAAQRQAELDRQRQEERQRQAQIAEAAARAAHFVVHASGSIQGSDLDGVIYRSESTQADCESSCRADVRCRAFTFDRWNKRCYLKDAVTPLRYDPKYLTAVRGVVSVAFGTDPKVMEKYSQRQSQGGTSYASFKEADYDDCADRCEKDQRCEGVNFLRKDKRCDMLERPGEHFPNAGADFGVKRQQPPP